jgi:hypothetical protein
MKLYGLSLQGLQSSEPRLKRLFVRMALGALGELLNRRDKKALILDDTNSTWTAALVQLFSLRSRLDSFVEQVGARMSPENLDRMVESLWNIY